eukprot:1147373-Pelagomonas_calceolata.AAC.3
MGITDEFVLIRILFKCPSLPRGTLDERAKDAPTTMQASFFVSTQAQMCSTEWKKDSLNSRTQSRQHASSRIYSTAPHVAGLPEGECRLQRGGGLRA